MIKVHIVNFKKLEICKSLKNSDIHKLCILLSAYKGPALVLSGSSSPAVRTETILKVLNNLLVNS